MAEGITEEAAISVVVVGMVRVGVAGAEVIEGMVVTGRIMAAGGVVILGICTMIGPTDFPITAPRRHTILSRAIPP